jgi:hypothetical protein
MKGKYDREKALKEWGRRTCNCWWEILELEGGFFKFGFEKLFFEKRDGKSSKTKCPSKY